MLQLQQQREDQQKLQDEQARRRLLDHSYRMKMKRLAREQQEELQRDMDILAQLLKEQTDEKEGVAQKKVNIKCTKISYKFSQIKLKLM